MVSYDFEPNYLERNGQRLHYVDVGKRDGEAIVMVHGNPSWSYLYRNLIRHLQADYRIIAPDHIGCGRSSKPAASDYTYTLEQRVADLDALIASLGLGSVHLVVHDWGGMIGTTWAVRNAERVATLTAMNTGAFRLPTSKPLPRSIGLARTPVLGALLVRGANAFVRGANRYCVTRQPMSAEVAQGFAAPYDSWANRVAVHEFVRDIPLRPGHPTYDVVATTERELERLKDTPMLFCWGMKDFVFDHHFLAEWVRHFPHAEVHRFEDAGHYVLEDRGEDIYPIVGDFLSRSRAEVTP